MPDSNEQWDRFRIKAEIHRRGLTLSEIAVDAGLAESSCRSALFGTSRKGAEAIADRLGLPMTVLFPGLYLRSRSTQDKPIAKPAQVSRQKRQADEDRLRAQA